MSSKWQPKTTPRNTPPWCIAPHYYFPPTFSDGKPEYIVASLKWWDPDPVQPSDLIASLKLPWIPGQNKWESAQPGPGLSLGAAVEATAAPNDYDVYLRLLKDGSIDEEHLWSPVRLGPYLPWSSGRLILVTDPYCDDQAIELWA